MKDFILKYGSRTVSVQLDGERFEELGTGSVPPPMSDQDIGLALDSPIGSPPLEDIVGPGERVLFVVPDATRSGAAGQIINLLVRRLIANGTAPSEMAAIFATGIHRKTTEAERQEILTPFIAQRLKTIDQDPRDLARLVHVGETSGGIRIELNRALFECDHVVTIGGVGFHYIAGFSGGRKLICPGLASSRTISATHRLAFDLEKKDRADGIGPGRLTGNPVSEAFYEAAKFANIAFAVNTITDDSGNATAVFCGDAFASHTAACESFAETQTIKVSEKRDTVFVSCGGYPHDVNLIQAHKALEAASGACRPGGRIILFAECRDGLGRNDLLEWFAARNSGELAEKLAAKYQVNGQTAWNLMRRSEEFDISIMSELDDAAIETMRLKRYLPDENDKAGGLSGTGYVIPNGARINVKCDQAPGTSNVLAMLSV